MNCNIIKDLIPLYIDDCCSDESKTIIEEHIKNCDDCKKLFTEMKSLPNITTTSESPKTFSKINDWKASVLQSVLFFISFILITVGVALEAKTPSGIMNGFWASNLVIPSTGFMLSLANWYFIRVYKNKKSFSKASFLTTLVITLCAYVWSGFHYGINLFDLFYGNNVSESLEILHALSLLNGIGIILTIIFCILSKILSSRYADMLGKE